MHYALLNKRIRAQAKAEADRQDLLKGLKAKGDEEKILRQIIMQNLDLQGSFAPPVLTDVLWVRIVLSPYSIARYFWWLADWHYRIDWKGQELTPEDCEYLILRNLGWSVERWDCAEDADKDKMVGVPSCQHPVLTFTAITIPPNRSLPNDTCRNRLQ